MRDDPFARLSGLDQKLFAPTPPNPGGAESPEKDDSKPTSQGTNVRPDETTSGAVAEGTKDRTEKRPSGAMSEGSKGRPDKRTKQRTEDRPEEQADEGTKGQTSQRTSGPAKKPTPGAKKKPASGRTSGGTSQRPLELPEERRIDRHPYDLFEDQVLWLNRMKVEIQAQYGAKLTASVMVQLALDLFMQDYHERGRRSCLVRGLVRKRPLRDLGYDAGTSGRPEERE